MLLFRQHPQGGSWRRGWSAHAEATRGFTLLESLVALAVVAACLAAIGQLGYGALAAARRAENRLDLVSAARAALAAPPGRNATDNVTSGEIFHDRWRLAASPFLGVAAGGPLRARWKPQLLKLELDGASGDSLTVYTVRLRRNGS